MSLKNRIDIITHLANLTIGSALFAVGLLAALYYVLQVYPQQEKEIVAVCGVVDYTYDVDYSGTYLHLSDLLGSTVRPAEGLQLFRQQCNMCHKMNKTLVGPPLAHMQQKVPNAHLWLPQFLRHQDSLILANDTHAISVRQAYGSSKFSHRFESIPADQLNNLVAYILLTD